MKENTVAQKEQSNSNFDQKQLKIIEEAIYPCRLRKDLKASILNSRQNAFFDIYLIQDNEKNYVHSSNTGRKLTFLPILLYLLFSNKKLCINFKSKKSQLQSNTSSHSLNINDNSNPKNQENPNEYSSPKKSHKIKQSSSKLSKQKSNEYQQSNSFTDQLFKEKRLKNFFQLIRQKIDNLKKQHKNKYHSQLLQNKQKISEDEFNTSLFQYVFQQITFKIQETFRVEQFKLIFEFLSMFLSVLQILTEDSVVSAKKLSLKLNFKVYQILFGQNSERYKTIIYLFSEKYWQFILSTKSIQSIILKIPYLQPFLQAFKQIQYKQSQSQSQSNQLQNLNNNNNNNNYNNISLFKSFKNIFKLQIQQIIKTNKKPPYQVSSYQQLNHLLPFLPNLKLLLYKIQQQQQNQMNNVNVNFNVNMNVINTNTNTNNNNQNNNQSTTITDGFSLFRTISQSNLLLQNLLILGIKLKYQNSNQKQLQLGNVNESKQQQQNKLQQKIQKNQFSYSNGNHNVQARDAKNIKDVKAIKAINDINNINDVKDINLFWLQKMQQNCPYLSFVKLQFLQKDRNYERRMQQEQRIQYKEKIQLTKKIMNLFFKRGMNIQTYFNTIKILQSENYDYQTILGILDKINPFAPI